MSVLVILALGALLWPAAIIWARHLEGQLALEETRPEAWEVAEAEAELPELRDAWKRRRR